MTRDEIITMRAGREMDALIWKLLNDQPLTTIDCRRVGGDIQPHAGYPVGHISPEPYSTDIAAAWEVVEKMRQDPFNRGTEFSVHLAMMFDATQDDYIADVYNVVMNLNPIAICRAALLAVMEVEP